MQLLVELETFEEWRRIYWGCGAVVLGAVISGGKYFVNYYFSITQFWPPFCFTFCGNFAFEQN